LNDYGLAGLFLRTEDRLTTGGASISMTWLISPIFSFTV